MDPRIPQFGKRLVADTPAGEKKMAAGFAALDKLLQDNQPMSEAKKKAIDTAYNKVKAGRGEK